MSKKNKKKLTWKELMAAQTPEDRKRIEMNLFFFRLSIAHGIFH